MLNRLGLSHTNEKLLEMGLLVDIYIPPSSFKRLNTTTTTTTTTTTYIANSDHSGGLSFGGSSSGRWARKAYVDVTVTAGSSDNSIHDSDSNVYLTSSDLHAAGSTNENSYIHNDNSTDGSSVINEGGRGVVIEIDGPSHFDSYLQVSLFTLLY